MVVHPRVELGLSDYKSLVLTIELMDYIKLPVYSRLSTNGCLLDFREKRGCLICQPNQGELLFI